MELIATQKNPVPLGGRTGTLEIRRRFGRRVQIRYASWPSALKERRGTVCIFPGRTEFIEKYFEVIGELRRRGFYVAILDWRGQGGSSRPGRNRLKGHLGDFEEYQADITRFMNEVVLPDCPPPYYVLAHSMGATIALKAATMRGSWFDRMVLTAPMLAVKDLPFRPDVAAGLAGAAKLCGLGRLCVPGGMREYRKAQDFETNIVTSDPERFARVQSVLAKAPELALGPPTFGWLRAAMLAMLEVNDVSFPRRLRVPVLIVAAGNDRIVCNRAIEQLDQRLKLGNAIYLRGAEHEILQERDSIRDEFWAAFDAFIPGAKLKKSA